MTSKSKKLLIDKLEEIKNKKYTAMFLGEETKKEVLINTPADMALYLSNARIQIDYMLDCNKKHEFIYISLMVILFFTALGIIIYGIILGKSEIITATGTISGLGISITWPINKLIKIRDDNIHLQKFLLLIPILPFDDLYEKARKVLFG